MTSGRWCIVALCVALGVVLWWPREAPQDNPQYDAVVAAHTHAIKARDSVGVEALKARVQNVVVRRVYTEARARLEPAFVKVLEDSATIHLNTETFTIPKPVAVYIVSLQSALDKADAALVAADSALAKTQQEVAAADTVSASADKVIAVLQEKPGFLSRVFARVKVPGAFLLGVLAARAVR